MNDSYGKTLSQEASTFNPDTIRALKGQLGWSCPSNIALVKYWGKNPNQIPKNPSLSITLSEAKTSTNIAYELDPSLTEPGFSFTFEGEDNPDFSDRVHTFINSLSPFLPGLKHTTLHISSENTFPHSSGIASSASAMAALSLCLVQIDAKVRNLDQSREMLKKASFIARLGSGSASRSIYPGMALWGATENWKGSSDEYAIPVENLHQDFQNIRDAILIVESGQKKVSSSAGHALMNTNPFSETRFSQARQNLALLKTALLKGNWTDFISILEEEALSLHAMMMTGRPGYILMHANTVSILHKIRDFRASSGLRLGFTLDAGANVHLLYANQDAGKVDQFIGTELLKYCEKERSIADRMGSGPKQMQL